MEVVQGCRKTINYETYVPCEACNGTGMPRGTVPQTCRVCKGAGVKVTQQGFCTFEMDCPVCGGTGKIMKEMIANLAGYVPVGIWLGSSCCRNIIHVDVVMSLAQAVLGGSVTVPTLTGDVTVKLAAQKMDRPELSSAGLATLVKEVMGLRMSKPRHIRAGEWDSENLTMHQIRHACADAFASFEIGRRLFYDELE